MLSGDLDKELPSLLGEMSSWTLLSTEEKQRSLYLFHRAVSGNQKERKMEVPEYNAWSPRIP